MSILHIAFYPSDWLAGTRGLSDSETGVYITLISRMYEMAGPIERDDNRLARLCGCKTKSGFIRSLKYLIDEGKIIDSPDGLFNERVEKEIQNATQKSEKARQAAQSRWDKKPNKNKDAVDASALRMHDPSICQLEPELDIKDTTSVVSKKPAKRATAIKDDWLPSERNTQDAIDRQFSAEEINHEASQFRDYHIAKGSTYKNWDAAWRTWLGNARKFAATRVPANQGARKSRGDIITDAVFQAGLRGFD